MKPSERILQWMIAAYLLLHFPVAYYWSAIQENYPIVYGDNAQPTATAQVLSHIPMLSDTVAIFYARGGSEYGILLNRLSAPVWPCVWPEKQD